MPPGLSTEERQTLVYELQQWQLCATLLYHQFKCFSGCQEPSQVSGLRLYEKLHAIPSLVKV